MKKWIALILMCFGAVALASENIPNSAHSIPRILPISEWEKISDVAQYRKGDWSQVVGQATNVSVEEAKRIAEQNPNITYFFHVKGCQLVLENNDIKPRVVRIFHHGDAVFFSGTPHWGSAPDLADGYVKINP